MLSSFRMTGKAAMPRHERVARAFFISLDNPMGEI
jgi:hypothetical protein